MNASHVKYTLNDWGVTPDWLLPFSLYLVVVNSLLEELLWRGFVLERLLDALARPVAVLISGFFTACIISSSESFCLDCYGEC